MPEPTCERRPAGNGAAITNYEVAASSLTDHAVVRTSGAPFALELAGVARRRVFFGVPAAERALARAHARGEVEAHLVLVRLVPVGSRDGFPRERVVIGHVRRVADAPRRDLARVFAEVAVAAAKDGSLAFCGRDLAASAVGRGLPEVDVATLLAIVSGGEVE